MKLIVHDMSEEDFKKVFPTVPENTEIITDDGKMHACVGCFGCWDKTPGTCVLKDGYENLGKRISDADQYIVISKTVYGSSSPFIKKVFDRTISRELPFFEVIDGMGIHPQRYKSNYTAPPVFIFYGDNISDEQNARLHNIMAHMNAGRKEYRVIVCNSIEEVAKEVSSL